MEGVGRHGRASDEDVVYRPRVRQEALVARLPQAEAGGVGGRLGEVAQADAHELGRRQGREVQLLGEGEGERGYGVPGGGGGITGGGRGGKDCGLWSIVKGLKRIWHCSGKG